MRAFILNRIVQFEQEDFNDNKQGIMKMIADADYKEKYHKFDSKCKSCPSNFDMLFRIKEMEYKYQLSILHNQIIEENLYVRKIGEEDAEIIFERSSEGIYLGEDLDNIIVEKLKGSIPLLSHVALNYDIDVIDNVIKWFSDIIFLDYDDPSREQQIVLPKEKKRQDMIYRILSEMDINISGIRIEKDTNGEIINVYTKHILEDGSVYEIPFEEESSGTRKLFGCLAQIVDCLQSGSLMVADELDAKLHPKLLRYIIELFTNPKSNKKGAQLLLTSHDMTTMIPEVYRRDEIWFCALNPSNASTLYSLIAFKKENGRAPRNDETYGKQYMEGRYGADPYLRRFLGWEDIE